MPSNINIVAMPTLGPDEWVLSSLRQADYLMAYFLAADFSQSYFFQGKISSFAYLVATYNNQPQQLISEVTSVLTNYFSRYFNGVIVECTDATQADEPSLFILAMYVQFQTADGTTSNISQLASISNSKFQLLNSIITTGDT
jgi:hypothetical protein